RHRVVPTNRRGSVCKTGSKPTAEPLDLEPIALPRAECLTEGPRAAFPPARSRRATAIFILGGAPKGHVVCKRSRKRVLPSPEPGDVATITATARQPRRLRARN